MSHARRPTASSKKGPACCPLGGPHKEWFGRRREWWWHARFKSVRVELEVTQSCRLLTDSALQLLKEDVSECIFFISIFFFVIRLIESWATMHWTPLFHRIPWHPIFWAYLHLLSILWPHMLLTAYLQHSIRTAAVLLKPTAPGWINKVRCFSIRVKIMVALHSYWIALNPGDLHFVFLGSAAVLFSYNQLGSAAKALKCWRRMRCNSCASEAPQPGWEVDHEYWFFRNRHCCRTSAQTNSSLNTQQRTITTLNTKFSQPSKCFLIFFLADFGSTPPHPVWVLSLVAHIALPPRSQPSSW